MKLLHEDNVCLQGFFKPPNTCDMLNIIYKGFVVNNIELTEHIKIQVNTHNQYNPLLPIEWVLSSLYDDIAF